MLEEQAIRANAQVQGHGAKVAQCSGPRPSATFQVSTINGWMWPSLDYGALRAPGGRACWKGGVALSKSMAFSLLSGSIP